MPAEDVARTCGISRSNVEKWTTEKVSQCLIAIGSIELTFSQTKIPIIEKCRSMLLNGMFNKSCINFVGNENEKQRKSLFDTVIKCIPSANSSLDPATLDLFVATLNGPGGASSASFHHSISGRSSSGYNPLLYPSSSGVDLQQFDDSELSEFADIGDFPGGAVRLSATLSNAHSSSGSLNSNNNKNSKVRKAAPAAASAAAPPPKRSKLMTELLEAAGLYFNEAEGSSSMNLEDYIKPPRKVAVAAAAAASTTATAAASTGPELPAKVITAVSDAEAYDNDQSLRPHHTKNTVSDMTMSYDSSALSDDRFSTTAIAASTTSQALRPVLKNTAFFTSMREQLEKGSKTTILDDRVDQKQLTAQEQLEEDKEVMRFLGERQYKVKWDKNDMKKFTITEG